MTPDASAAPTPSADFKAKFFAAWEEIGTLSRGIPAALAYAVASLETARGTGTAFLASNNLFSIHAEAGTGKTNFYWKGTTYTAQKAVPEILRVYASWEDSMSDFALLLSSRPWAAKAYVQAVANNPEAFFLEMQASGYAGKSTTYAAGLARCYREVA